MRVTGVRIAQILTTVSNAKTHQTRPILVTDLRNIMGTLTSSDYTSASFDSLMLILGRQESIKLSKR